MTVFTRQLATAQRLIAKNGAAVIWRHVRDDGMYDDYPVKIVFLSDKRVNREFIRLLTGTDIPAGSEYGLMAGGLVFTPANRDLVFKGNVDTTTPETVSYAKSLQPDLTPLLWTIGLEQ